MTKFLKTSVTLFIIAFAVNVNAQSGNYGQGVEQASASTNLTVNVADIVSIAVATDATINLDTKEAFLDGAVSETSTMTVFATRGYNIHAKTSSGQFEGEGLVGTELPDVNTVNILITEKGGNNLPSTKPLSGEGETVLISNQGAKNKEFNVVYEIPKENTEAFLYAGGKKLNTTITYTITLP
ncbi:MAG TPA: hypothetical protein VKY33_07470 [Flavobacterium sp.]|nr:hypothetical protein [Flavobacterium sp.]